MSVWRAYEELKQLDLMKVTKRGRSNWIELNADPRHWSDMVEASELAEVEFVEDAASVIELWHYDPKILVRDGVVVDRLSLYAQFWNHPDERVTKAAEDLLEQVSW